MDGEKIDRVGEYTVESVCKCVDDTFADYGLKKVGEDTYTGVGTRHDFAHLWSAILSLAESEWFMEYVDTFLWYENDDVEDLAAHYRGKFGLGA
jgi:hypothetical protein